MDRLVVRLFIGLVTVCALLGVIPGVLAGESLKKYAPTDAYRPMELEGFPILVLGTLIDEKPELCERTLTLLRSQLNQIVRRLPGPAVEQLRKVRIWVELNEPHHPCMCYHPDPKWLEENDMNPEKAGSVELANAENFLTWTLDQPWMVLHELAHAYHHQFLEGGFENSEVAAAYAAAMKEKRYDQVLRVNGRTEKHYAATNPMEYFAEASEAYFGANDFFPFVRSELAAHDREMYDLLGKLWRVPGDAPYLIRRGE